MNELKNKQIKNKVIKKINKLKNKVIFKKCNEK